MQKKLSFLRGAMRPIGFGGIIIAATAAAAVVAVVGIAAIGVYALPTPTDTAAEIGVLPSDGAKAEQTEILPKAPSGKLPYAAALSKMEPHGNVDFPDEFPVKVSLEVCGTDAVTVVTECSTVIELLAENGIFPDSSDLLSHPPSAAVTAGMVISYDNAEFTTETVSSTIPHGIIETPTQDIPRGSFEVVRKGEDGLVTRQITSVEINGVKAGSDVTSETVISPIDEIRLVGSGGTVEAAWGESLSYSYCLEVTATAYGGEMFDGLTYSGTQVRPGVIAVDPKTIPLGSRCYIEGYGILSAEDTGRLIKGNRIDIYFDADYETLMRFGRQEMTVYVLD